MKSGGKEIKQNSAKADASAKKRNDFLIKYFKFIILSVVLVILASGLLFLKSKYEEVVIKMDEAGDSKQAEYEAQLRRLRELRNLKSAYSSIDQENINKVNEILPNESTHENLLAQMEAIILKNGLVLKSLSVESIDQKDVKSLNIGGNSKTSETTLDGVGRIKINMNILGTDYERFKSLLVVLENNLRLIDIENLSFSPAEKSTSLTVYTYYLKK